MPYVQGKLKGQLTAPELRRMIKLHNKMVGITIPTGSKRDDLIKIIESNGFKIDHAKQKLIPTSQKMIRKKNVPLPPVKKKGKAKKNEPSIDDEIAKLMKTSDELETKKKTVYKLAEPRKIGAVARPIAKKRVGAQHGGTGGAKMGVLYKPVPKEEESNKRTEILKKKYINGVDTFLTQQTNKGLIINEAGRRYIKKEWLNDKNTKVSMLETRDEIQVSFPPSKSYVSFKKGKEVPNDDSRWKVYLKLVNDNRDKLTKIIRKDDKKTPNQYEFYMSIYKNKENQSSTANRMIALVKKKL
tara:strand:+ start:2386 stop:3282 length:897 start_codon:yes stop_codon:yes gene_type:complete